MQSPFTLPLGTSIFAKITATNAMGTSSVSTAGNGAILSLSTVPSSPVTLARDSVNTWSGQITVTWTDGASNGGQPIDYYRVSHDQSTGTYIEATASVTTKSYTITGLTPGNTYNIKVEAHNAIGFSVASQPFAIIAATSPSTPNAPTTAVSN